jgi:hypothetical protein
LTSFRGQAKWAKVTSPVGKLIALPCHPTKRVNKAEELKRKIIQGILKEEVSLYH